MSVDGRGSFPGGNQSRRDGGSLEQRIENLLLIGFVEELSEDGHKARVRFGEKDSGHSVLSGWLSMSQDRYGETIDDAGQYDIGERVAVLSTSGMLENGFIFCALPFRNDEKDTGSIHITKSKNDSRTIYGKVKSIADLVLNSFTTFNRITATFWHYLKEDGSFRFEVGKDTKTNTYIHIKRGVIEARVFTNKFRISGDGIEIYYGGTGASIKLNTSGLTVAFRNAASFATVAQDIYGGTTGSSTGVPVTSVNGTGLTTLQLINGRFTLQMDDKVSATIDGTTVNVGIKDHVQLTANLSGIEATAWQNGDTTKNVSLLLKPDLINAELRGNLGNVRTTLTGGATGTFEVAAGSSRLLLNDLASMLAIPGTQIALTPSQLSFISTLMAAIQSSAPGITFTQGAPVTQQAQLASHPIVSIPDDLSRPEVELGVKPFTPSYT